MSEADISQPIILQIDPANITHIETASRINGYIDGLKSNEQLTSPLSELKVVEVNYSSGTLIALIRENPEYEPEISPEDNYLVQTIFSKIEGKLFIYFMRKFAENISYKELLEYGWGYHEASDTILAINISRIRAKLSLFPSYPNEILTISRYGYIMVPKGKNQDK